VKYAKRNFVPGRSFRDIEDLDAHLVLWQVEVALLREHGITHQRPIDRFSDEAAALAPTARYLSFLRAMVRHRMVVEHTIVVRRAQIDVQPEHGPDAALFEVRQGVSSTPISRLNPESEG
jgi:hypothetical protein